MSECLTPAFVMVCVLDWCLHLMSLCLHNPAFLSSPGLSPLLLTDPSQPETVWNHTLIHSQVSLLPGLCSLPSYMVFQSALTIFTLNINRSPKTSLKNCRWVFSFSMKKLSWTVMSMVLFSSSFETLKHSSHEFSM